MCCISFLYYIFYPFRVLESTFLLLTTNGCIRQLESLPAELFAVPMENTTNESVSQPIN